MTYFSKKLGTLVLELMSLSMIWSDTGIVPPLIYAMLASSREIVIGPGSVDSLLLSSMIQTLKVPIHDSSTYIQLVFTVTFFAGIFQVAFGLFRYVSAVYTVN